MTDFTNTDRLTKVELIEERPRARTPEIQQELDVAVFDLIEDNRFKPVLREDQTAPGPYRLGIGMAERVLLLRVYSDDADEPVEHMLSLSPLRGVIKDYFAICEQYFDAVKRLPPAQIEAIDMARRGIHNEGARILQERLESKAELDIDTARRLFTLICVLHFGA